jgi:hypothetical protein
MKIATAIGFVLATLPAYAQMPEAWVQKGRQYTATDPGWVGPKMDCLRNESLRGNPEAIGACGVPRELYLSAIGFVAELNVHGELVSTAFLRKFCQNSLEVGVSFSCSYGGVTLNFGR